MNTSWLCRLLAVTRLLLAATAAAADLLEGRVVRIADGDTLTVLDGDQVHHRVRLAGIDLPERAQPLPHHYRWDTEQGRRAFPHPR